MAAGIATLRLLAEDGVYRRLDEMGATLADGLRASARAAECDVTVTRIGSMMTVFFTAEAPFDYASAKRADTERYGRFHRAMLDAGFYLPPAQFEAMFVSLAHTPADLQRTFEAARKAFEAAR